MVDGAVAVVSSTGITSSSEVIDSGVLDGVPVANGGVLQCGDRHELEADCGGGLTVVARAGTKVETASIDWGGVVAVDCDTRFLSG